MHALICQLGVLSLLASPLLTQTTSPAVTPPDEATAPKQQCASFSVGQIQVKGNKHFGVADQIGVVRLNAHSHEDYDEALRRATAPGDKVFLYIFGTPYAFVLSNGAVQPLLVDTSKWEVWRLDGLGKYFSKCQSIFSAEKRVTFGFGMPDTDLRWSFDFGDKGRGVIITLEATGGF